MPRRLKKIFAPLALVVLLLSSCAIQSPQARIERNPEIYEALTAKQQELVSQGQIAKGMTKPGVARLVAERIRKVLDTAEPGQEQAHLLWLTEFVDFKGSEVRIGDGSIFSQTTLVLGLLFSHP